MTTPSAVLTLLLAILPSGGFAVSQSTGGPPVPSSQEFGEAELQALLTATLQRDFVQDKGELEVHFTRRWPTLTITNAPVTVKILDLPTAGVTGNFIVRFQLQTAGRGLGTFQVPVRAHVWRDIWVARSSLRRGEPLTHCDRGQERRDLLAVREPVLGTVADDAAYELAETVPAGQPLLQRSVKLRTLVRRGQVVEAVVRDTALAVAIKVEVLEDGARDQQIRVRNLQSKRELRGKVLDEATVVVSL